MGFDFGEERRCAGDGCSQTFKPRSRTHSFCPACGPQHQRETRSGQAQKNVEQARALTIHPSYLPSSEQFGSLADYIQAVRRELGVSVSVLGMACGLGNAHLGQLINCPEKRLWPSTQQKLVEALGVTVEELERLRPSSESLRLFYEEKGKGLARAYFEHTTPEGRHQNSVNGGKAATRRRTYRSTKTLATVGGAPFAALVRERLAEQGKSFARLHEATGVHYETIMSKHRPRPETVVRVARYLRIDPSESMVLAGWPKPWPLALAMLHLLGTRLPSGQRRTRESIADELRISRQTVDNVLLARSGFLRLPTIAQLGSALHLSEADIAAEQERSRAGHSAAMRTGALNRSDEARAAQGARSRRLWSEQPTVMLRGTAASKKAHAVDVADDELRALIDQGASYRKVAQHFGVSDTTIRDRARRLGLRSTHSARRRKPGWSRAVSEHQRLAGIRHAAARQDARDLGQYVDVVDYRTFALTHGIGDATARRILEEARAEVDSPILDDSTS